MFRDLCRREVVGTSDVVTDDSETFRRDNVESEVVGAACNLGQYPLQLRGGNDDTTNSRLSAAVESVPARQMRYHGTVEYRKYQQRQQECVRGP